MNALKRIIVVLPALLWIAGVAPAVLADDAGIPDNPDSMFGPSGDESSAGTAPAAPSAAASSPAETLLLESRAVEVGGSLSSDYTAFITWADDYPDPAHLSRGASDVLIPNLGADLYFDARPTSTFRAFTKLRATYPFSSAAAGTAPQSSPFSPYGSGGTSAIPNISVFELYADVSYNDQLYLRVGQQVVNWGVGYFFSPADILSLTPIDPLRPGLTRQGPVALKAQVPFADADNLSLYVILNQAFEKDGAFRLADAAAASRVEILLGNWELGVGGYYQRDQRPKAMMTATGSLIGKVGVFAEGVAAWGADRTFAESAAGTPGAYETFTNTSRPYLSGTVGLTWVQTSWHVSLTGQYYYNGQGYADAGAEKAAYAAYFSQLGGALPVSGPALSATDVFQPGRHYIAGLARWTDILASRFDLGLFYEANLTDGSGVVSPSVSWSPFQYCTLTLAPYVTYGEAGTELVSYFGKLALSFKLTIGEEPF